VSSSLGIAVLNLTQEVDVGSAVNSASSLSRADVASLLRSAANLTANVDPSSLTTQNLRSIAPAPAPAATPSPAFNNSGTVVQVGDKQRGQ
jgi:hypothetical protein